MSDERGAAAVQDTGSLRMWGEALRLATRRRVQIEDATDRVVDAVARSGLREGLALLSSRHTTLAVFVNEAQAALLEDVERSLASLVPRGGGWRHDDPAFSDCDRRNADAHLRAMLLGHSVLLSVRDGRLVLGRFQAVIVAELDGPRERTLDLHVLGTA